VKLHLNPPCLIFTRADLGKNDKGEKIYGYAQWFLVYLLEGSNKGVLEHELEHVRQFWELGIIHGLRIKYDKKYLARCEAEAMEKQLAAK